MAHHVEHSDDEIGRALAVAHGVLPDQGPIGVFVHHNTLHAFQHLPFHEAVQKGAELTGARPYLGLDEFREAYTRGRIESRDIDDALCSELGSRAQDACLFGLTRLQLWRALMTGTIDMDDAAGLRFTLRQGTAAPCRDLPAWYAALAQVESRRRPTRLEGNGTCARHRDALLAMGVCDPDTDVHPELTRLCAGFLDQGQAQRVLPGREAGFLKAVARLYAAGGNDPRCCPGIVADFREIALSGASAHAIITRTLELLGVPPAQWEAFVLSTALGLPGWAGMFSRLERHPHEHEEGAPTRLDEFLAVRLVFDRRAIEYRCKQHGLPSQWESLRAMVPAAAPRDVVLDAHVLWGIARAAGATSTDLAAVDDQQIASFWSDVNEATPLRRRKVWQDAYEARYRRQILDALLVRRERGLYTPTTRRGVQVVFCIDEREESMRRAIEEQGVEYETFGVAGFFGMAIDYQGLYDQHPAAHCPVVVTPAHEVHEAARSEDTNWHQWRLRIRDRVHHAERVIGKSSHTLTGGAGAALVLGPLAGAAVAGRVMAPRGSLAVRDRIKERFLPRPRTQLSALREEWQHQPSHNGKPVGFSLDESVERVAGLLRSIGLVRDFAPIIVVLGHGSTSLNNPHESAHDCGACGGRRGGANARLFAEMANRADVRRGLEALGIAIPADTCFVGGMHDTADDKVTLYDVDCVPSTLRQQFEQARVMLERARRESARERARRFDDAPLGISPDAALAHVEARAAHLAQPRPEYGHCTNAIAVVGRRAVTRGLHLDRRPFLISYDPAIDSNSNILERILAAVGPVGAGISLEYYFSSVDNERYGCGTKLPHNVTGLLGVMNGHQGDLRTGLPLQMVELHEPMRLLLIVEATVESLLAVASRQAEVRELVVNEWVRLVSLDPDTGAMQVFLNGGFFPYEPSTSTLPEVNRSIDWHGNTREFVTPALVTAAMGMHA